MKKLFLITILLTSFLTFGQNPDRLKNGLDTKFIALDTLTTAQRNALTLKASKGYVIFNADTNVLNIHNGTSWAEISGGGAVDSVNGQTGVVVLDADDISDTSTTNKFVTSAELALIASAVQDLGDLGITSNATELNYVSGVTSNIQTQFSGKLSTTGNESFSGLKTSIVNSGTSGAISINNNSSSTGGFGATFINMSTASTNATVAAKFYNYNVGVGTAAALFENTTTGLGILAKNLSTGSNLFENWSSGTLLRLEGRTGATGKLLSITSNGSETASITKGGVVTATSFVGDGSGLTGIPSGTTINNTLTSTSTTEALSAAQGKVLKDISDTQQTAIDLNTAKITNATHTGDVTGATTLTIEPTAISGKTSDIALTGAEELLMNDGGTLKKTTTQAVADLSGNINTAFRTVTPSVGVFTEDYNDAQPNFSFTITQNTVVTLTTIANGNFGIVEVINATTTPYIVQLNGITNRTRTVTNETVSFTYTTNDTGITWYENYKTQATSGGEGTNYAAQTGSGTSVINFTDNNFVDITLTANEVPIFTAPSTTTRDLTLYIRQDATGGRTFTFPTYEWGFPGGTRPTITATANALDIFKIDYLAGKYYVSSFMQNLVAVDTPTSYTIEARINAGGTPVTATDGEMNWEGGNSTPPFTGTNFSIGSPIGTGGVFGSAGVTWIRDASIPVGLPTADYDSLYDDIRYGDNTYTFAKGNGTYKVTLYLAEDNPTQTIGARVFDVIIEGVTVESGIDIREDYGIGSRSIAKIYDNIIVTDGVLNLLTNSTADLVLIAAIQIEKQD